MQGANPWPVAAARLGAKVYGGGTLGDDAYIQMIESCMKIRADVDHLCNTKKVYLQELHTPLANRDSIIVLKVANDLVNEEIDRAWSIISTAEIVLP